MFDGSSQRQPGMIRQTVAHVDLAAIETNFRAISTFVSTSDAASPAPRPSPLAHRPSDPAASAKTPPRIMAVVKANAYGHGASEVGLALERAGAAMLACADIEEGIVLRRAGVRLPILVFGALGISDLEGVFEYDLTPTISTPAAAENLADAAARVKPGSDWGQTRVRPPNYVRSKLRCHLKIDTGMNRLGFRHDNLERTLPPIAHSEHLAVEAVYT